MALYPDTSCFYRAEVIASPSDTHPATRVCPFRSREVQRSSVIDLKRATQEVQSKPMYKLKFEDDGDEEHSVPAMFVIEWPG